MTTSIHNNPDPRTYHSGIVVHTAIGQSRHYAGSDVSFYDTSFTAVSDLKYWIIDGDENVEVAFNRDILRWVEVREDV